MPAAVRRAVAVRAAPQGRAARRVGAVAAPIRPTLAPPAAPAALVARSAFARSSTLASLELAALPPARNADELKGLPLTTQLHISMVLAVLVSGLGSGCSSMLTGSDGGGGRVGSGAAGSGGATGADGSLQPQGQPMSPCSVDSDCGNAYLTCVLQTVYACHEAGADAGVVPANNLPVCPTTAQVTENLCSVRYQLPCQVDSDCGPAGFTCSHACSNGMTTCGICSEDGSGSCSNDDQCPQGWSCYTPCPCGRAPSTGGLCNPPFAIFNCPACIITPVDGG